MEQTHSDRIKKVGQEQAGMMIGEVDGLITGDENVFLMVKTADCLPLIFFDPRQKVVGAAHAGWTGGPRRIVPGRHT